jgi:hypothetical protein
VLHAGPRENVNSELGAVGTFDEFDGRGGEGFVCYTLQSAPKNLDVADPDDITAGWADEIDVEDPAGHEGWGLGA